MSEKFVIYSNSKEEHNLGHNKTLSSENTFYFIGHRIVKTNRLLSAKNSRKNRFIPLDFIVYVSLSLSLYNFWGTSLSKIFFQLSSLFGLLSVPLVISSFWWSTRKPNNFVTNSTAFKSNVYLYWQTSHIWLFKRELRHRQTRVHRVGV